MKCERCDSAQKPVAGLYDLYDYCPSCGKNLCASCMAKGCCGKVPAVSGMGDDDSEGDDLWRDDPDEDDPTMPGWES